jgi:hypothetical protein
MSKQRFIIFAKTVSIGGIIGALLFSAGTGLALYDRGEQRRLWHSTPFPLSKQLDATLDFQPEIDFKYYLDFCLAKPSSVEYDQRFSGSLPPKISADVRHNSVMVGIRPPSSTDWSFSSRYKTCTSLGSFVGDARQVYQIHLNLKQVNTALFEQLPYLNIRFDDTNFAKSIIVPRQLFAVSLQLLGIVVGIIAVIKGAANLFWHGPTK